jgi:hypothetical protein
MSAAKAIKQEEIDNAKSGQIGGKISETAHMH